MPSVKKSQAFTLIELLVVIAIIIILAGITYTVINPALQRRKASQNVMASNLSKLCLALSACAAGSDESAQCNSETGLGVAVPNGRPLGSTYAISNIGAIIKLTATLPPADGSSNNCILECSQDFDTGEFTSIAEAAGSLCAH